MSTDFQHEVMLGEALVVASRVGTSALAAALFEELGITTPEPVPGLALGLAKRRAEACFKTPDCIVLVLARRLQEDIATFAVRLGNVATQFGIMARLG